MASWCDRGRNKRSALAERGWFAGSSARRLGAIRKDALSPRSASALTLARRDATDPAPRLEAPSHPASARASRQANVTGPHRPAVRTSPCRGEDRGSTPREGVFVAHADQRVGFVTWIVGAAVLIELAYKIVWP